MYKSVTALSQKMLRALIFVCVGGHFLFYSLNVRANEIQNGTKRLIESSVEILNLVRSEEFNAQTCDKMVNTVADRVWQKNAAFYYPKSAIDRAELSAQVYRTYDRFFHARFLMLEKFKSFQSPTADCISAVRRATRYFRYIEESLLFWKAEHDKQTQVFDRIFEAPYPYLTTVDLERVTADGDVNSTPSNQDLKVGDVILVRGKTFISSLIARIGDEDANFSHLAIVGQDFKGNKVIVESLVETGLHVVPLEKWLAQQDTRNVLYRYKDEAVAQKAGELIYQFYNDGVIRSRDGTQYDFAMNDEEHSEVFCSEVVRVAYELATSGSVQLPKYRTQVSALYGSKFMSALKIHRKDVFSPSDIELDPNFVMVAEFRIMKNVAESRLNDAIFSKIFEWMLEKDYTFRWSLVPALAGVMAEKMRSLGLIANLMQRTMDSSIIETALILQEVYNPILKKLKAKKSDYENRHGHALSFQQSLDFIEQIRVEDCRLYRLYTDNSFAARMNPSWGKVPEFHLVYRSDDLNCE